MQLPDGHHEVSAGKLAMIVTSLAMTAPPPRRPDPVPAPWRLERVEVPEPEAYRALYRRVGQDWLERTPRPHPGLKMSALKTVKGGC